jgi:hypothetical protein
VNRMAKGNTLMSDGEHHRAQRAVVGRLLTPKSLAARQPQVQALADTLVDGLVEWGLIRRRYGPRSAHPFHTVSDLLHALLVTKVERLEVGIPVRKLNNHIRAFARLPIRMIAAWLTLCTSSLNFKC